jgi:hypothetical protein
VGVTHAMLARVQAELTRPLPDDQRQRLLVIEEYLIRRLWRVPNRRA